MTVFCDLLYSGFFVCVYQELLCLGYIFCSARTHAALGFPCCAVLFLAPFRIALTV